MIVDYQKNLGKQLFNQISSEKILGSDPRKFSVPRHFLELPELCKPGIENRLNVYGAQNDLRCPANGFSGISTGICYFGQ